MPISRRLLAVLAVAAVLTSVATAPESASAASCSGNSHAMKLSGGTVAPGQGTTATKFTFSVTYTDNDSCVPDRIVAVVVGVRTIDLSYVSGSLPSGATFARTVTLPAGSWSYRFEASSGAGAGRRQAKLTNVSPAKVVVRAATAAPTARPPATAAPTPRATPKPTKAPPSPEASKAAPATPSDPTPVPTPLWTPFSTVGPSPTPIAHAGAQSSSGPPIAMLKLLVAGISTIGGLVLFVALSGRWLRLAPGIALPPVPRRRRDDRPDSESVR